jgi:integrase
MPAIGDRRLDEVRPRHIRDLIRSLRTKGTLAPRTVRSALRWRHYDAVLEPLGRLLITSSWSSNARREKATKSEQQREVPVHPALAATLAAWRDHGWQMMMDRAPGPDDLVIPSHRGLNRSRHHSLDKFHEDLDRLGMRRRRQHDLRRTFISLAIGDGARKDVLRRVTHGPSGDVVDQYTSLPWASVCEEVAKFRAAVGRAEEVVAAA